MWVKGTVACATIGEPRNKITGTALRGGRTKPLLKLWDVNEMIGFYLPMCIQTSQVPRGRGPDPVPPPQSEVCGPSASPPRGSMSPPPTDQQDSMHPSSPSFSNQTLSHPSPVGRGEAVSGGQTVQISALC